jgi:hypothetical protein
MSRLRRTGLTIDDPLAPATADQHATSARQRDDELAAGSSDGPTGSTLSPKPQASAARRSTSRQGRRPAAAATSNARKAPTRAATATPASGAWRAWSGQTRVASYRLPDELLAELASTSAELQLPVGLLVAAAIADLLDKPAGAIGGLVDRADDARIQGRRAVRRSLIPAPDGVEMASDMSDTL